MVSPQTGKFRPPPQAEASSEDTLIRITAHNRSSALVELRLLPTLWFRNTWSWNGEKRRPRLAKAEGGKGAVVIKTDHPQYGPAMAGPGGLSGTPLY